MLVGKYLFKVNKIDIGAMSMNFVLVFLLLTQSRKLLPGIALSAEFILSQISLNKNLAMNPKIHGLFLKQNRLFFPI